MRPKDVVLAASVGAMVVAKTSDVDFIPCSVVVSTVEAVVKTMAPLVEPRREVDSFKDAVVAFDSGFRFGKVLACTGLAE